MEIEMFNLEGEAPVIDRKERIQRYPIRITYREPEERCRDFAEIRLPYTPAEARSEAMRCLQCPHKPCQKACPLHNDIPAALAQIELREFVKAGQIYAQTNPMPEICGRICPQQLCEASCVLNRMGRPLALRHLEAFAAQALSAAHQPTPAPALTRSPLAIVGGGPAGLGAAEYLIRRGHPVTVYEKLPHPGGLLRYGIPSFKLNKAPVQALIQRLESLGVIFRCNTEVGREISLETLRTTYGGILLTVGAGKDHSAGLPGENLLGVYSATEFLVRGNVEPELRPAAWQVPVRIGPRVHVLGGGDTAVDCLRTALRLPGVTEVTCYYRRSEAEMPAHPEDYFYAGKEGARFVWLTAPVRFTGDGSGRLTGVVYQKMELGEPGPDGRRQPIPVPDSERHIPAETVVLALGFGPDPAFLERVPELRTDRKGLIVIEDARTGRTNLPGVFAAGDAVEGPDLLAPAVAAALRAAAALSASMSA